MIIAIILFILLLAVLFAWFGMRSVALSFFAITFIFAIASFFHHITETIGLSL